MVATTMNTVRGLFPVTRRRAYLFAGGLCPAATPVTEVMQNWLTRWAEEPLHHRERYFDESELLRQRLGRILGADPDQVALTDNTSRAANLAVELVHNGRSGNVVVDATTYPSSLYPWLLPNRSMVEVRRAGPGHGVADLVDDNTIAVSVSHVCPLTGFRHDLDALATLAHAHGARLVVDAAQSVGAVALDVERTGVDVLTGTTMKWLLGPPGVGFLYARAELTKGPPPVVGYAGIRGAPADPASPLDFRPGARRLELGLPNLVGVAGARRGADLVLELGLPAIEDHVVRLSGRIVEELRERGLVVRTPRESARRAGVVALDIDSAPEVAAFLRRRGVDIWGYPEGWLRADPHCYNTDDDVTAFLDGLDAYPGRTWDRGTR